ncbi:MAG: hypothetical protein NVSMB32_10910 [Actinomycetota bacterium]
MDHKIIGTTMPVLEMQLAPGESVVSESGELSWMSSSIRMTTSTKAAGSKGLFGVMKRALGGGSLFMTEYRAEGGPGMVAFATKVPGLILPIEVGNGREYMVHHHGYLCGTPDVELTIGFQQTLGAGLFGGEGFILQKVAGSGQAWVELDGELVEYQLGPADQLLVHPGHVGMFETSVNFSITRIPGIKNVIFGADGLFLVLLSGPGHIWLQSLPLPNLAHALSRYLPQGDSESRGGPGGMIGGILGGLNQ